MKPSAQLHRAAPPLIGLTGPAGCGKDTVARILADQHGVDSIALAAPLRAALCAIFDWEPQAFDDRAWKERPLSAQQPSTTPAGALAGRLYGTPATALLAIDKSPRQLLQTLGTEWGRNQVHPDLWLLVAAMRLDDYAAMDAAAGRAPAPICITDIRFDNEAAWLRQRGGVLWHIERGNTAAVASHSSEHGVPFNPQRDQVLDNNGSLLDLADQVARLMDAIEGQANRTSPAAN